jgi:DNA-binding protein HU-beta
MVQGSGAKARNSGPENFLNNPFGCPIIGLIYFMGGSFFMTKVKLIAHIADETGISKKAAAKAFDVFVGAIHDALRDKNKRIHVADLGTFRAIEMPARNGVNPRTLEKMTIPAMVLPRFTPSKALREAVTKIK